MKVADIPLNVKPEACETDQLTVHYRGMTDEQHQTVFPKKFLWGAATSAHQVEGNNHNDWSEWEKRGLVHDGSVSGLATGHYQRFREDFALAKELGHNAHRFSIEWSRIEPAPGRFDMDALQHYRQVLQELQRLGIEPVVTLHHFTNPIWIHDRGGWTQRETVNAFGRYVQLVVEQLSPLVKYWITINEPTVNTSLSYVTDVWPPQKKNWLQAWTAIRRFGDAHRLAYQIIHRIDPHAQVGVANNLSDFVPARPNNPLDQALQSFSHFWHNRWWLDLTYQYQDFIGLNYYFHHALRFKLANRINLLRPEEHHNVPKSDLGWELYPAGLGRTLNWLSQYDRPIIITENGLADANDIHRPKFIVDHVTQVRNALARGIDIRGYLHWSLLDNFEWREGYGPRFGLVAVNYKTLARTPRPSAYVYRDIIRANGADAILTRPLANSHNPQDPANS